MVGLPVGSSQFRKRQTAMCFAAGGSSSEARWSKGLLRQKRSEAASERVVGERSMVIDVGVLDVELQFVKFAVCLRNLS